MGDLFDKTDSTKEPLAARMRPRNLDEYIGQDHIVGKGRLLRRAIQADRLTSVIFYGPPGTGKTTLARVIANHTKSDFITLNAVLTGVADIRTAISQADNARKLYGKKTILFVDEVHRWNKSQQDALLPWVENGTIILIGATTENPFFEVNKALVSRSRVFQLKPLEKADLLKAAQMALSDKERGYGNKNVVFEDGALEHLVDTANGDARSLLNALELAVETTDEVDGKIFISREVCEESIQKKVVLYDRDGDYHYDIISAFIKSLRGRDADAAMYWLARMVRAGEDADFIFRRMLISACEDTGLADPTAISIVQSCAQAFDRVGMPEGRYFLAHAALYLATAPKSNSSMAFFDALASVEKEDADVPNHLRDSSRDAEGFGHGQGYMYPHAYRDHWVAQQYLPDALVGRVFYTPSEQGYEKSIKADVLSRREIQIAAIMENSVQKADTDASCGMHPLPHFASKEGILSEWWVNSTFKTNTTQKAENLTFTPTDKAKESALDRAEKAWRSRLESNRAEILSKIRDALLQIADLSRHTRSLILNADDALLVWALARKTPEGITCGLCKSQNGKAVIEQYSRTLDELDRPRLSLKLEEFSDVEFDRVFMRDAITKISDIEELSQIFSGKVHFALSAKAVFAQHIPKHGQHLSRLIAEQIKCSAEQRAILEKMAIAENEFFENTENPLFAWDADTIKSYFESFEQNKFVVQCACETLEEKRRITERQLALWFDAESSAYAKAMLSAISQDELAAIKNLLLENIDKKIFSWKSEIAFFSIYAK